jgi:catechol 2,3-dioxygenase-like lactoylglutathione lyase family enzyme
VPVPPPAKLVTAVPVLASLDIPATVKFYVSKLGFKEIHAEAGSWGIVERDAIQIHFWHCNDRRFPENTSCRVQVQQIDTLHAELQPQGVTHPNGPLRNTEWGTREFDILDLHGNLITFFEGRSA